MIMIVYFMWFMKFMVVQSKKYYDKTILFKLINYTFTNKAVFPFLKKVYYLVCLCTFAHVYVFMEARAGHQKPWLLASQCGR